MSEYFRPIPELDPALRGAGYPLAGGWCRFARVEVLRRGKAPAVVPATELPSDVLDRLTRPRPAIAGCPMDRPRLMGILNVTPDSFSDGGQFTDATAAVKAAQAMAAAADIIDIGGESTRPGASTVPVDEEMARTVPVIAALRGAGVAVPISIDTRKAPVAKAALEAGATMVNDVSALCFDPEMAAVVAGGDVPLCLMHAQGTPETMQADPRYDDALLDVYDELAERIETAVSAGIRPEAIVVDPGIGFGKTLAHNLRLLRRISLFHALGAPILLGVSRKRFIGEIGRAPAPQDRAPGSIAVALAALEQGVQIVRVHDVEATRQAMRLWQALRTEGE
ncbi:MAG: dihydropteroate synthase [Alphaproteobacteria bacterium]|nr:MAG: dihydropteroate synthase [Alphaproteobacteria bacterium]